MPKVPRLTASEAEALLLKAGFTWLRSKGSHRIYDKAGRRVVVPFHSGVILHRLRFRVHSFTPRNTACGKASATSTDVYHTSQQKFIRATPQAREPQPQPSPP